MSLARRALQYVGVRAKNPPNVQLAVINPTSQNDFIKGDLWLNTALDTAFMWSGDTWIALGSGTTGAIVTLTGGSGGALSPTAGNMNILGTANQITSTGSGSTITFSLPSAITAPGSLTTTTSLAATTTITAGTTITATAGDITATLGNIVVNGAAKHFSCHGGAATDFIGTATLTNGVATVLNTNIAATDRIEVTRSAKNASTAYGVFEVVKSAGVNFVITSCKSDTTTETGDQSTVEYFIVRQV
jgi:hypothetical protein